MKEANHKRVNAVWFYFHEVPTVATSTGPESRMVGVKSGGQEGVGNSCVVNALDAIELYA